MDNIDEKQIIAAFVKLTLLENIKLSKSEKRYFQAAKPTFFRRYVTDHGLYVKKCHPRVHVGLSGKHFEDTDRTYHLVLQRYQCKFGLLHILTPYRHYDPICNRLVNQGRFFWEKDIKDDLFEPPAIGTVHEAMLTILMGCDMGWHLKEYQLRLRWGRLGVWLKNQKEALKCQWMRLTSNNKDLPF